jgi:hypothetical protein
MSTIAGTGRKAYVSRRVKDVSTFWKKMEANRYGSVILALLTLSIMGGIAAADANTDSWIRLAAVTFSSTLCLALFLAVAPMRFLFSSAVLAVCIDLFVMLF